MIFLRIFAIHIFYVTASLLICMMLHCLTTQSGSASAGQPIILNRGRRLCMQCTHGVTSVGGGPHAHIYTIIFHKSVCRRSQTAGRNTCSIFSGDVSNGPYLLKAYPVTSSHFSSV